MPQPATELRRAGSVPLLGSRIELTLLVGAQVRRSWGTRAERLTPPHLSWGSKGKANMLSPLVTCGRVGLRSMKTEELALRASIQRVSLALLVLVV